MLSFKPFSTPYIVFYDEIWQFKHWNKSNGGQISPKWDIKLSLIDTLYLLKFKRTVSYFDNSINSSLPYPITDH